ncbi:type II toxin-antitoxin system prevent-host-death family antitoxin [Salibacterium halotolerans]|uniref:Prevent-host-death family protein n=1 Tax=Salibacterium halotolerans TaxID=1884432 RepID=A0A1I5VZR4_9BACI|nr:type II toxin-antitoxin system prevent-host-death family antitoxin [Salibacterium halotolerans]SFQ12961.1 prevent-host-death family protein [Salibacterium halotolerans]
MIVRSTELQNNFGKYLRVAAKEDVIVTRNGVEIARLVSKEGHSEEELQESTVQESAASYHFRGRTATFEEFLELTSDGETRYEYMDGKIYLLSSPRVSHQYVITQLLPIFHQWAGDSGCIPFTAPYDIRPKRPYDDNPNVVQPDLMIICDLNDNLNDQDYYTGVPLLVVEILSESTQGRDLVKKLDLYMECGVKEYWIVDPLEKKLIIYHFKDQKIHQTAMCKPPESARSFLFEGLSVELNQLFMP